VYAMDLAHRIRTAPVLASPSVHRNRQVPQVAGLRLTGRDDANFDPVFSVPAGPQRHQLLPRCAIQQLRRIRPPIPDERLGSERPLCDRNALWSAVCECLG
jgi:hypothetical protein